MTYSVYFISIYRNAHSLTNSSFSSIPNPLLFSAYAPQRAKAIAIGTLSLPIGTIISLVFAPVYIKHTDAEDAVACKEHLRAYMLFTAVQITAMTLPLIVFYQAYPEEYPSKSA